LCYPSSPNLFNVGHEAPPRTGALNSFSAGLFVKKSLWSAPAPKRALQFDDQLNELLTSKKTLKWKNLEES